MTAAIIPFKKPAPVVRHCSFCKRPEPQLKKLVEGMNGHCICDKCIALATQLLAVPVVEEV